MKFPISDKNFASLWQLCLTIDFLMKQLEYHSQQMCMAGLLLYSNNQPDNLLTVPNQRYEYALLALE
jgi:hypothetical protein